MERQSSGASAPLHGDAALLRAVGIVALTAAVINVIVGGGIFKLPAALATTVGTAAPLAYLAGALAIIPIALCFAAAGSRVTVTGGPYTYVERAFGPFSGFISGALMWITNLASSAAIAAALTDQAATAFELFRTTGPRTALLIGVYAGLVALNAYGVKLGARAIVVLATLKLTPLVLLAAIGLFFVDWSAIVAAPWPGVAALGTSMVLVMFAYSGMETALVPSGEVSNPSRDVPRATLAAIAIVVLLYLSLQLVCQALVGAQLAGHRAPVAAAAGALWTPGFGLLLATASVSMLGFLQGNMLGSSRLAYALARDGYLPEPLSRITATRRVPLFAVLTHSVISCALAIAGNFAALALLSGGAVCLVYVGVALAAWKLERGDVADHGPPFRLPGGSALVPALSILAMALILATLSAKEWLAIAVALAILVLLFLALRRGRAANVA